MKKTSPKVLPFVDDARKLERNKNLENTTELKMSYDKLSKYQIAKSIQKIIFDSYINNRNFSKNNKNFETGKLIADLVHADEECIQLYTVCIHYIISSNNNNSEILSVNGLYRLLQTSDPDNSQNREIIDILFSRDGLCPDNVIAEYMEVRKNCSDFNQLCKRARDALLPYTSLRDDELMN